MALHHHSNKDFKVTDDELLRSFLYNKIHNNPLPDYMTILEHDLFGTVKNPCEIWEEFAASHSYCGKDLYFFTTLKKKSATSSRMVRTIGTGTWEGEDSGKIVIAKDTNQLLGVKKRYRFEKSKIDQDNGGWILHEYRLDESLISNPSANNYVLCRFRKNLKLDLQNPGPKIIINQQSNSQKNSRAKNVGQNKQRNTVVPPSATTTTMSSGINTLLNKFTMYEPINKSNDEQNKTNLVNEESQYKEEQAMEETTEDTIVLALEATTKYENNNVDQKTRNQLESENNKTDVTNQIEFKLNNEDGECFMNKEDDGDIIMNTEEDDDLIIMSKEKESDETMPWAKYFSQELMEKNEGCSIEDDDDVEMLPNHFYEELLLEYFFNMK